MKLHVGQLSLVDGTTDGVPDHLDSENTLVLVFGPSHLSASPAPLLDLARRFPQSQVLGCSTAGEIMDTAVADDTLTLTVCHFDRTPIRGASAEVREGDCFEAGRALAGQLDAPDLRAVLVVSDGLHVNGSDLAAGLNAALPDDVVVTGGLAADGDRFERTWVLYGDQCRDRAVAAVGLYGPHIDVGHGSRGGWDIFGPQRRITRSEGNVLYELDGRPALELYKHYLGDRATGLPATALLFPLALRGDGDEHVVRTVLSVDEASQSMTFAGDVPEGAMAQLMRANFDRLIEAASGAARDATPTGPTLSVAISCVGRRLILGERTEEELEATFEELPDGSRQVGFYSYGEISPLVATGPCTLHNQTMTLTTIRERDSAA